MSTDLYRLYDDKGVLLYVGVADEWASRVRQHAGRKPWWPQVKNVSLQTWVSREDALEAERAAIKKERPLHNIVHNYNDLPECRPRPARLKFGELGWTCDRCGHGIANNDGYIHADAPCQVWEVHHRRCDPHPEANGYWFGVERIRTDKQIAEWEKHLFQKVWIDTAEWAGMLRRQRGRR